ncbi:MAG: ATPase, T2SS/T4P/T4SS family, partial [Candidatus Omnitrophica bacterium]|nr:ATPase, T2SS/T4P/T4SS family [Candidatus Omnitrophota bacterium]
MSIRQYLKIMVEKSASDMFYRAGACVHMRIDGKVVPVGDKVITLDEANTSLRELMTSELRTYLQQHLDADFGVYIPELDHRFRVSIFMQRNWPAVVVRNISSVTFSFDELNLPAEVLRKLSLETRGLVLLTGTMGSGKSTAIASIVDYINSNCNKHILTIEEPIEFTFKDKNSIVNQRELGLDVSSY